MQWWGKVRQLELPVQSPLPIWAAQLHSCHICASTLCVSFYRLPASPWWRVLSDLCIETEAGDASEGSRSGENEVMQGLSGMCWGRRGKYLSYITVFSRINLAYIWKPYTCLKCSSKEQFIRLRYFMWELGEKENTQYERLWIQSPCEREHGLIYVSFP